MVPGTLTPEACLLHKLRACCVRTRPGTARDADSRYLLAQCCLRLGKLPEAEQALRADYGDAEGVRAPPLYPLLLSMSAPAREAAPLV